MLAATLYDGQIDAPALALHVNCGPVYCTVSRSARLPAAAAGWGLGAPVPGALPAVPRCAERTDDRVSHVIRVSAVSCSVMFIPYYAVIAGKAEDPISCDLLCVGIPTHAWLCSVDCTPTRRTENRLSSIQVISDSHGAQSNIWLRRTR